MGVLAVLFQACYVRAHALEHALAIPYSTLDVRGADCYRREVFRFKHMQVGWRRCACGISPVLYSPKGAGPLASTSACCSIVRLEGAPEGSDEEEETIGWMNTQQATTTNKHVTTSFWLRLWLWPEPQTPGLSYPSGGLLKMPLLGPEPRACGPPRPRHGAETGPKGPQTASRGRQARSVRLFGQLGAHGTIGHPAHTEHKAKG